MFSECHHRGADLGSVKKGTVGEGAGHDSMVSEEEKGSGYRGITAEGAGMIDRNGETERVTKKYHYSYPHPSRFLSLPSDTFLR